MGKAIMKEQVLEGLNCAQCAAKIDGKAGQLEGAAAKKVFILKGLDCANCAQKIEKGVQNIQGVKSASLDFVSCKLVLEAASSQDLNRIIAEAGEVVNKIEPGVNLLEEETGRANATPVEGDKKELYRIAFGAALFLVAFVFKLSFWPELVLYSVSYALVGGEVVVKAVQNIFRGRVFDENFLMTIATVGAFAIKEFPEGVSVMLFYQIGEYFQDIAVNRSRKSIKALLDIRPDFANLIVGNDTRRVAPEEVKAGDLIIIKPGERVPLDGKVVEGKSMVDTSALTGESVPREIEAGNEILSGFINKSGLLTVEVTKEFGESTISRILDLVQNASSKKAPTENFITKFARIYTPVVVFGALGIALLPPLFVSGATFAEWLYRALVFLVISCPCALVVSIPLGFFGGIGGASKNGILIKGGNYLEALNDVDTIVFDKTGTLTKGVFKVTAIKPNAKFNSAELLEYAAFAEAYSNHPIAVSILKAYGKEIDQEAIENYVEIAGHGIKAVVKGKEILAGNAQLMQRENIPYSEIETTGTVVHLAIGGHYAGYILISDELKEDAKQAMYSLKAAGIRKLVMLTGDAKAVAVKVAQELGLDEVHAELLPDQKVEKLENLAAGKVARGKVVFVGDGINDAPVLARADVGVAMGGLGSDAAIEAADVVLMTDELSKLVSAIKIARRTRSIVWQNIVFALGVKGVFLLLGAVGVATLWEAVFADVGVTIIAVLNSMRVLNTQNI